MRTATLASNETLVGYVLKTKARVEDLQAQVSTEKRSQTYAGLAADAPALVDLEQTRAVLDRYQRNNAMLQSRLDATTQAVGQARSTVEDFRTQLVSMASAQPLDASHVTDIQEAAFRALKSLEATLNQDYNGRFLFAGSQTTTQPVSFGADTLAQFQAVYDGSRVVYPPTRDAHVGARATLGQDTTGGLTFAAGPPGTIQAANGCFANLAVGATIEISGSTTGHDGVYTVVSKNAGNDTITVEGTLTDPGSGELCGRQPGRRRQRRRCDHPRPQLVCGRSGHREPARRCGARLHPRSQRHRSGVREGDPGDRHHRPGRPRLQSGPRRRCAEAGQ